MVQAYTSGISKFKAPAGLNGDRERSPAKSIVEEHKQAPKALGPFADLLLHATNLAHRCEYAHNK